ncbi:hypothetical protein GGR57DRAFT_502080 [Xylariaceae sp. FL1272]|nr:hypothetical protein GGR57DRAFT_502080 [Xylariaceae sp. FL1272]
MKYCITFLIYFFGLATCFPKAPSDFSRLKHMLYENDVIDPDAYYAVDHLIARLADPVRRNETLTNSTDTTDIIPGDGTRIGQIPSPDVKCYPNQALDFTQTMLAAVQLAQLCQKNKIPPHQKWSGVDPTTVSRVFVCNWGDSNNCELGEMLEAIGLITEKRKGTYAGVVYVKGWNKAYGIDIPATNFCPSI